MLSLQRVLISSVFFNKYNIYMTFCHLDYSSLRLRYVFVSSSFETRIKR